MNKIVEQIAKAIQANGSVRYGVGWNDIPDSAKDMFYQDARAAISAMRKVWTSIIDEALADDEKILILKVNIKNARY